MAAPTRKLIAVVDETGTTNRPVTADGSDFGIAGIVFPITLLRDLRSAGIDISRELSDPDFKFKHVQKSASARTIFLRAMNKLRRSEGVYGYYTAERALMNERHRAYEAVQRHGSDPEGHTKAALDEMLAEPNPQMMRAFFNSVVPSFGAFATKHNAEIDIYLDRRTDLTQLLGFCEDAKRRHRAMGVDTSLLHFKGAAQDEHQPIVRLAGVVAGDIRQFFRKKGPAIWERFRPTHDLSLSSVQDPSDPDEMRNHLHVADLPDTIADGDIYDASAETSMLRGYTKRLLTGLLSFASPKGILGHIHVTGDGRWELLQLPD